MFLCQLIFLGLITYVFALTGDGVSQFGQVNLNESPVFALNKADINAAQLGRNKGCRGRGCGSSGLFGPNTPPREGFREGGYNPDYEMGMGGNDYNDDGNSGNGYGFGDGGWSNYDGKVSWVCAGYRGCRRFKGSGFGGSGYKTRSRCERECGGGY